MVQMQRFERERKKILNSFSHSTGRNRVFHSCCCEHRLSHAKYDMVCCTTHANLRENSCSNVFAKTSEAYLDFPHFMNI